MKTTLLIFVVFFSALMSCNSQGINKKPQKDKNTPHEKVTVNRKYDKNGNLVEFDSTYTSYYSNVKSDTVQIDSVLNDFPQFFNEELNMKPNNFFNSFFIEDTAFNSQFFHDDYFEKQFLDQNENMLKMMQRMDSLKNAYFEHYWRKKN